MNAVYLDNNATTQVDPAVLAAMLPYFVEQYGNASSKHTFGADAAAAVRDARRALRDLLGAAQEQEIIFTSGGTEANNTALLSALDNKDGRREVITSTVEHPAILALCGHLERHAGVVVRRIAVDRSGRLDMDQYRAALGPRTAIVSFMWANNETGVLFPVEQAAMLARDAGALFHTDAVQVVGKHKVVLANTAIDMLSLSAHKFHGPKGIGALFVRKGVRFCPLLRGGQQERARRGGTENVPAIVGLGHAASLVMQRLPEDALAIADLRNRLEQGVRQLVPDATVLGASQPRVANTSSIVFDRADAEAMLHQLDQAGIAASSGSACSSGSMEPSHVLRAMRVPFTAAHGALRFSFSRSNQAEDVDRLLAILPGIVERARAVSLFAQLPATTGTDEVMH